MEWDSMCDRSAAGVHEVPDQMSSFAHTAQHEKWTKSDPVAEVEMPLDRDLSGGYAQMPNLRKVSPARRTSLHRHAP